MSILGLAARNVFRNKLRVFWTIAGVAVAIIAFVMLRTVIASWETAVEHAAKDRIGTRHKVSFIMTMPRRYIDAIRGVDGVQAATFANWFGAKDPNDEDNFFASLAVDTGSFLEVYDEIVVTPEERTRWLEDRQGVLIGDVLARRLKNAAGQPVQVGDDVTLTGTIFPGTWTFHVSGIYRAARRSIDRSQFLFHYDYLNEQIPERRRDEIGWIVSRVDDPARSAEISTAIDRVFETQDVQTLSMSERAMNNSFMAMFDAVLKAINWVSIIILVILLMLLGNTIAMGVRERTNEYGVLRALGFLPRHVATFIYAESTLVGLAAGVVGTALAFPIVELGLGRFLEEEMGAWFPYFRIHPLTMVAAVGFAVALGAVAAAIPAARASRLSIIDALRRSD